MFFITVWLWFIHLVVTRTFKINVATLCVDLLFLFFVLNWSKSISKVFKNAAPCHLTNLYYRQVFKFIYSWSNRIVVTEQKNLHLSTKIDLIECLKVRKKWLNLIGRQAHTTQSYTKKKKYSPQSKCGAKTKAN